MGIERSKLTAILRSVNVEYFGEQLRVTYKPSEITPAKEAELARARREAEESEEAGDELGQARNAEILAERLSEIMVDWDVLENGEPLPPNKENLMTFANSLLVHISQAIGEDMAPKVKTGKR